MPGSVRKILAGRWESPFTVRLKRFVDLTPDDVETLRALIEFETPIEKRRDLVVDGYPYNKLCFVKDGIAARYKVLRNGKRQIVSLLVPGDIVGLDGRDLAARPLFVARLRHHVPFSLHGHFVPASSRTS